jgi:hypothetical protein
MIWLALRRHRTTLLIATGLTVALGIWMALVSHWYDTAPVTTYRLPNGAVGHYQNLYQGLAIFRLPYQVDAINLVLLAFPCVLGLLLGVPLVAGELDDRTNRLVWTQQISRTRWLTTKWWVVGFPLVVLVAILTVVAQWWAHHVGANGISAIFGPEFYGASGKMQPEVFSATGVVPLAYTVFAFALGTALGALLRRVSWAIVATLVVYAAVSLFMITTIRPDLAPQTFVPFSQTGGDESRLFTAPQDAAPWFLGAGFQFVSGSDHPTDRSATQVGLECQKENPVLPAGYLTCLARHHDQDGQFYQAASNYWLLQWRESLIYVVAGAILLVTSLVLVRRWRA